MDEKQAAKLRGEFSPDLVGKLPKINCTACSQAAKQNKAPRDKHCDRHQVTKCAECDNYITTAHIHLDYIGHAETTDRLLQVDPEWTWRPMGITQNGLPALDEHGGLWIMLTIGDVSKPGYGDAGTKTGPNAVKEAIGDAIRNAAMRFGVALDLWAKSDLHAAETEAEPEPQPKPKRAAKPKPDAKPDYPLSVNDVVDLDKDGNLFATDKQRKMLFAVGKKEQGLDDAQIRDAIEKLCGTRSTAEIPRNMVDAVVQELRLVGGAVPK